MIDMNKVNSMKIAFTNEKGNAKVAERNVLRRSALRMLHKATQDKNDLKVMMDNGMAFALGTDVRSGETIWAHFTVTISTKEPEPAKDKDVRAIGVELFNSNK
jgi:hypothetical protein